MFAGTGAIIINGVSGGAVTSVGIGLTFGLIVLAMIYAIGDVSGAHLNPAVTRGFFAGRRLEARMILPYILSQVWGALVAPITGALLAVAGCRCVRKDCCSVAPSRQYRSNMKQKVLFICVHNSARSQMAEVFLDEICGDQFEAHSAGLEPGKLNPLAVEATREIGIDISQKQTQSVFDVFKSGELFSYVITVCDETNAERCPIFPGVAKRLHWSFPDPAAPIGTHEKRLAGTRKILDEIRARIEMWCDEICPLEVSVAESV